MKRMLFLIRKELAGVRSNLAFHLIVTAMPIMFLCFWVIALNRDVTFPVALAGAERDPEFAHHLVGFTTPGGTPYFEIQPETVSDTVSSQMNIVRTDERIRLDPRGGVTGVVKLNVRNIDRNMTKNYRNRLTGAVTSYLEENYLHGTGITINEHPIQESDVPWTHFFVGSIAILGMLMGAMLFGALGITLEWSSGTITFLRTSPVSPAWILAAKQLSILGKGVVSTGLTIIVASLLVPGIRLPVVPLLVIAVTCYWTIGLIGTAVGIIAKDPITCFLIALLGSISFWLLGNGFGDMTLLGSAAGRIAVVNPATHLLRAVQHVMNGTPIDWRLSLAVFGAWTIGLQIVAAALYLHCIHLPRRRHT